MRFDLLVPRPNRKMAIYEGQIKSCGIRYFGQIEIYIDFLYGQFWPYKRFVYSVTCDEKVYWTNVLFTHPKTLHGQIWVSNKEMKILVWESYLTLRTKQNSSTQPILLSCYSHNVLNSVCYVWTLIWGLCASCMKHFPKCSLNTPLQKKCLSHNLTNKICAFILCERIWEVVLHQVIMVQ